MDSRNRNGIVGVFVLLTLVVLLFSVYFLKETIPGHKMDAYYGMFDQVSTLQVGDPVKVNGVRLGKVTSVDLEGNSVKVGFQVRHGLKLSKDSELRIQNIGLMGERQLGIHLGTASEILKPGDGLQGSLDAGIAEAMGVAGRVFVEADSLVKTLRQVIDSTLGRPEFASRVNNLLASTEDLTRRISSLEADIEPQIRDGAKTLQGLSHEMDGFVRAQEPKVDEMTRNGVEASQHAKELAARGERVAQGLEEVLAKMNSKNGTLGALLSDTTLHHDLRSTLKNADSLFRSINKKGLNVNLDLF